MTIPKTEYNELDDADDFLWGREYTYPLDRDAAEGFQDQLHEFADEILESRYAFNIDSGRLHALAWTAGRHICALLERLEWTETALYREKLRHAQDAVNSAKPDNILEVPGRHCVYILWGDAGPVYVGQSSNVFFRLGQHMNNRERRGLVKRVQIIHCADTIDQDETERFLIMKYRPRFNIQYNPDAQR